ncbi:MerR family transcriptional regulator [Nonomuraea sp. SMC257]|uniref:MerR family transcriptional regulator n=1 Tax=Nonomuraea montanisoli TaxID=2741721 RepID=A0A7Y6I696_9ACTN|nr:MerR family transcriptional regulator [Nonomuraea montanisoli]
MHGFKCVIDVPVDSFGAIIPQQEEGRVANPQTLRNTPGDGGTLRPVDLARLVGLSTQQIRNYADAGVLPPAPRTEAGYRRFGPRHREALLTYRALAAGHSWERAGEILGAVNAGDAASALALVDAGHAALHEQRVSLQAIGAALEEVAVGDPDAFATPRPGLRVGEVAARLGVRTSALRLWEASGLIRPGRDRVTGYRTFGPDDVRDAQMVRMLREARHPLPRIRLILDALRRTGSTDALRAALAERRAELERRATAMLEGAALLHRYVTGDLRA